jgi:exonuclease SbcC
LAQEQLLLVGKELAEIKKTHIILAGQRDLLQSAGQEYRRLSDELARAQAREKSCAVRHAALEEQAKAVQQQLDLLAKEIVALKEDDACRQRLVAIRRWFDQTFVPLAQSIESHVLAAVHRSFDALFRSVIELLIDDPSLVASVDSSFGVRLVQNSYETGYEMLSGGERTAIALAYRLALHKVVSTIMTTIRTAGLLILDEPTDGFSAAQLDKVRDALGQLGGQVIVVSHEPQLEGFADHVLRVSKHEHVSSVG